MTRTFFFSALLGLLVPLYGYSDEPFLRIDERFADSQTEETPSFRKHILPLMGRLGCNGRACHGSFQGQGGFRLSLFGYDFDQDHQALLNPEGESRVDTKDPKESLILQKPTMAIDHDGGILFEEGEWSYNLIYQWIRAGAPGYSEDEPELISIEIIPDSVLFQEENESITVQVLAHWSDGTVEDVTPISRFQTNDSSVATVDEDGLVTCVGSGDTHVVAFYDNGVAPLEIVRPVTDYVGRKYPSVATTTAIDYHVVNKLKKLGIVPSPTADDETFLRRIRLDLTGTLPSPEEIRTFLQSSSTTKRAEKIEELLNTPEYAAWWATKLCDFTGNNPAVLDNQFRSVEGSVWYDWIYDRVAKNESYDEIVSGIVMATSRDENQSYTDFCEDMSKYYHDQKSSFLVKRDSMPYFWQRNNIKKPQEKALAFAYTFLGVRLQCAECHKHPFDQWTQQDFQQFQAFFEPINYGLNPETRKEYDALLAKITGKDNIKNGQLNKLIRDSVKDGKVVPWRELYVRQTPERQRNNKRKKNKSSGRVLTPKLLGGEEVLATVYQDPREALMEWMLEEENPYFATAFVNRVWANYFNVGIIDPPDDLNLANPPSNKPLLDYLSKGFIHSGFDMKWLHREILLSDTYQRTWEPNETNQHDVRNFSHAILRRLPAEVALDALTLATASDEERKAFAADLDERAIGKLTYNQARGRNRAGYSLEVFGISERATNCDCDRSNESSLLQTVFLRNDDEVLDLLTQPKGWIASIEKQYGLTPITRSSSQSKMTKEKYLAMRKQKQDERELRQLEANLKSTKRQLTTAKKQSRESLIKKLEAKYNQLNREYTQLKRASRNSDKSLEKKDSSTGNDEKISEDKLHQLIEEGYLRTLGRFPTEDEQMLAKSHLASAETTAQGLYDLLWALINTKEFLVNH
ncbi:Cytochrome c domain-containing protein [Planctomycetales bacterium 10988]|nr:Cytochrome c domain-containing protein [Planctomycetales bacterium 10988]